LATTADAVSASSSSRPITTAVSRITDPLAPAEVAENSRLQAKDLFVRLGEVARFAGLSVDLAGVRPEGANRLGKVVDRARTVPDP